MNKMTAVMNAPVPNSPTRRGDHNSRAEGWGVGVVDVISGVVGEAAVVVGVVDVISGVVGEAAVVLGATVDVWITLHFRSNVH